ncbi:MAG: phosphoglycerate kinase [Candidatus Paceibacterota bacterium]
MSKTKLPSVKDIKDLKGTRVLLRASLNVPIEDGAVTNQFRIMRALPTINYLRQAGAQVVVIAHIGRKPEESLMPVYEVFKTLLKAKWCPAIVGEEAQKAVTDLKDGDVLLLENVRSDEREKANDPAFAKELASYADIYINDAFAASHRTHASLVGVSEHLPSYFGFNFLHEYEELQKAADPKEPSLFILGGAKFDTKMPLVEKYANTYTNVFIGGALANDMFKAAGHPVGKSLVSDVDLRDSAIVNHLNILTPTDVTVTGDNGVRVTTPDDVASHEIIYDAGPKTIEMLMPYIQEAKSILWNGPLGNYEKGFNTETEALAKAIAAAPGYAVVGGGDTIAAIELLCIQEQFGFLSTAGGAMLTFLEHGTLPAITAVVGE